MSGCSASSEPRPYRAGRCLEGSSQQSRCIYNAKIKLTLGLLCLVASDGTDNSVLLALEAVTCALDVLLRLGGLDLSLTCSMLLASRVDPRGRASQVADGLDGGALGRVVLAGGLVGLVVRHDV